MVAIFSPVDVNSMLFEISFSKIFENKTTQLTVINASAVETLLEQRPEKKFRL